jgi:FlaA1/EpsC-like NDP-sugar epimerase
MERASEVSSRPSGQTVLFNRFSRRLITITAHAALWTAGLAVALMLRFDGDVPRPYQQLAWRLLPALLVIRIASFWVSGLFHGILRYAGMTELKAILRATTLGSLVVAAFAYLMNRLALPRSVYLIEWLLALGAAGGLRFAVRLIGDPRAFLGRATSNAPGVLLIGAGNAGELLIRDLQRSPQPAFRIVSILDDDPRKSGSLLHGVRIEGAIERDNIQRIVQRTGVDRVVLAIPTAPGVRTREIVQICRELGLTLKSVPSLQDIADGKAQVSLLRDVNIEDLLRRDPVELDSTLISKFLAGRRVLVTGAAGSIGSELVRQIARFNPAHVLLLDFSENGLFYLERELSESFPDLRFSVHIADIRDEQRVSQIFREGRPDVVYHAAAHKHVPLMELNPGEAIRNNSVGTRVVAEAAGRQGCDAFVLISTDKAVNPTSVMGTTKRVAEMFVQSLSAKYATRFVAVRFGNVLGSAGSVVPIFRDQIAAGGPVRVTHPEMRRYFMTIPEASQLVLQASALGRGGEIFILDMGEPVKIVDLARDMIVLSGFQPDVDIQIEFTGTRPGEKLYEELMLDDEAADATAHPKIRVARIAAQDHQTIRAALDRLETLARQVTDPATLRAELSALVPEATLGGTSVPPPSTSPSMESGAVPALAN